MKIKATTPTETLEHVRRILDELSLHYAKRATIAERKRVKAKYEAQAAALASAANLFEQMEVEQ